MLFTISLLIPWGARIVHMSIENSEIKIATRAIIVVDGKILLGKRGRGFGENKYALIGGKPDGDETPKQAVVREVREETGLTFKDLVLWREIIDGESVPGETWRIYFFHGQVEGQLKLKDDEVLEIIYVDRENLSSVDIAFNHREMLTQFFSEMV